jgi:hypothetical protein
MSEQTSTVSTSEDPRIVNLLVVQFMQGIVAVLGLNGLERALQLAGLNRFRNQPPADSLDQELTMREYARLHQSIAQLAGRAGRRTLMRVGQAAFYYRWDHPHQWLPLASLVLKTTLPGRRPQKMLRAIATGRETLLPDGRFRVQKIEQLLVYEDFLGTACFGQESTDPVCHGEVGFLQAAMAQATGRETGVIQVVESACKATGSESCRFEIQLGTEK